MDFIPSRKEQLERFLEDLPSFLHWPPFWFNKGFLLRLEVSGKRADL